MHSAFCRQPTPGFVYAGARHVNQQRLDYDWWGRGNATTITISHLLYYYREASDFFAAGCFGENIISSDAKRDSCGPKAKTVLEFTTILLQKQSLL